MNALSPVSADLIGRVRSLLIKAEQEAEKRGAALFVDHPLRRLLRRAEKCHPADAHAMTIEIMKFLEKQSRKKSDSKSASTARS